MKKLIILAMSGGLALGSVSVAFAGQQDPPKQEKKSDKKGDDSKKDKKGEDGKKDEKGKDAGKKS